MALLLRRAAVFGGRATVPLVLGLESALFLWALAAAFGLAALVTVSEVAYAVLRIAGTVVLVVLGVLALRAGWRSHRAARDIPVPEQLRHQGRSEQVATPGPPSTLQTGQLPARRAYVEGLVTNLANPKAAVFMLAFFPQFIPHGYPVLPSTVALALIQVTVETALYCALGFAVGRARSALSSPRVRAWVDTASGAVLLGLGVKIATSARAA